MIGQLLRAARSRRQAIDALVRQVAEASLEGVCRLAADRVTGMSPCEARGYIRGRAGREIRRQTRLALARHAGVDASWHAVIVARAADRLPPLALRKLSATATCAGVPQQRAA